MSTRTTWGWVGICASLALSACGGGGAPASESTTSSEATTESSGGDEASDVRGSCAMLSMFSCEEYRGPVEAAQLDTRRDGCSTVGGTWSDGACPTEGAAAGCNMPAASETGGVAGTAMVAWLYVGNPALCPAASGPSMREQCEQGGSFIEVAGAPTPECPAP